MVLPAALLLVGALKLWLVAGQRLTAIGWAIYDDALYLRAASHLLEGRWLGAFDQLTLVKDPGYPFFIAATSGLGIPLLLAQHLLYLGACALLVLALRPLARSPWWLLPLFAALALNPATFGASSLRVIRAGIYPALTVLVVACVVGVHTRSGASRPRRAAWGAGLGVSLFALWITRAEGVWILPLVGLVLAHSVWARARDDRRTLRPALLDAALPLLLCGALLLGLSAQNHRHYGIFGINELKAPALMDAYGALQRVTHRSWVRGDPVPRDARARIYRVSPTFAQLRPFLEGKVAREKPGGDEGPIEGDRFLWDLRGALVWHGQYRNGADTMRFYEQLAVEVNRACDDGRLPAGPPRASLLPPWRREYLPLMLRSLPRRAAGIVSFEQVEIEQPRSLGRPDRFAFFERMTHERLAPLRSGPRLSTAERERQSRSLARLRAVHSLYRTGVPVAFSVALGCALFAGFARLRGAPIGLGLVLATGVLAALLARTLILLYIDASLFPTFVAHYLAPTYPLVVLFCFLGPLCLRRSAFPESPAPSP